MITDRRGLGSVSRVYRALAFVLLLASCAPQFVAPYDPATDAAVTDVQQRLGTFFAEQQRTDPPVCDYGNYVGFYDALDVELGSLVVRNEAREQNQLTVRQLRLLGDSFDNLEVLHQRSGCLPEGQLEVLQRQFDTSFTAILRLELAKRR